VGAALAGCGLDVGAIRLDDDEPVPPPTPGPDELARRRAVESSVALVSACRAAGTVRPNLLAVVEAVEGQHLEHLEALGVHDPAATVPSETPTAGQTPTDTVQIDPVAELVAAHSAAASQAMTDLAELPGPLAALLARIAACRAVQARALAAALSQPTPPDPVAAPSTEAAEATGTQTPTALDDDARESLTAAVDGRHAAVYGYGVLAAHLAEPRRQQAVDAMVEHDLAAETLVALLEAGGAEVPVAAPAYRLPSPVTDEASAAALAARLESSLAAQANDLVGSGEGEIRSVAVDLLLQASFAAVAWGAVPVAFPGD
jgi:hypothetical protein